MITVKEIVKRYLTEHKYDGLYRVSVCDCCDCCCKIDDLLLCGECLGDCEPGYFVDHDCEYPDHEFHIGPKKSNPPGTPR